MGYQTFGDIKTFAMDMLSEEEQDSVFQKNLLSRWADRTRNKINQHAAFAWKEGSTRLVWPGISSSDPQQPITSILYLPEDMDHILSMFPANLSYRESVKILTRWEFDQDRPGNTIIGARDILVLWGYYGVKRDNPNTTQLTVTSDAAGTDSDGVQCRIEGRDSDNEAAREVVTLASGSATTVKTYLGGPGLDGVTRFTVLKSSLTGVTDPGVVKLLSAGVELESLDVAGGEIAKERRRTELYAQIGGPGAYNIAYYRRPVQLISDNDSFLPGLPVEFNDLPEDGIMMHIAMFRKEWDTVQVYKAEFNERMRELRAYDDRAPGYKGKFTVRKQASRGNYVRR